MSPRYSPARAKLMDCRKHGPGSGAELLLVEGDSALASVCAVRTENTQAVLALQGKPLNAWQASAEKVAAHAQYQLLEQALGLSEPAATAKLPRFERVLLLFDPDADGIHIGALLVLYCQRWQPWLIEQQRLWQVRAPMFELVCTVSGDVQHADNPLLSQQLAAQMAQAAGGVRPRVQSIRGLGSIAPEILRSRCLDPQTRHAHVVGAGDVQAVIDVFGGPQAAAMG